MKKTFAAGLAGALFLATPAAQAAEGMWLPGQAPALADQLRKAGLELDPAALANLTMRPMNAIASLGGCSASFVSPQGLVVTNHHCAYGSIQFNSTPQRNLIRDGFLARTMAEEVRTAPGSRVFVIERLDDVTAAMMRGVTARLTGRQRTDRVDANRKALVAACEKQPGRRCDVRAYFGGSTWYLQQQLELLDVRLVYAPAGSIGNFGGEVDNWQWPRHTGDFAFYRAYVGPDGRPAPYSPNNVPYRPQSFLQVAREGVKEGDFVLVAGFPGQTERYRTAEETRVFYRDLYPLQQRLLDDYSDLIVKATAGDEAAGIKYASILKSADNIKKKLVGQMDGARQIDLVAKKEAIERRFGEWAARPENARTHALAIGAYDAIVPEVLSAQRQALIGGTLDRAQLLRAARDLYRWARERGKPDAQREIGFQDRDRRAIADRLTAIERRFAPQVEKQILAQAIRINGEAGGPPGTLLKALQAANLDQLYAGTRLGDTAERLAWLDRPAAAFEASDDPMIRLAVLAYPDDIAAEGRRKDRDGRVLAARSAYMNAYAAWARGEGRLLYPDANGSLRFTYGRVAGRQPARDGMSWSAFTTPRGILEKDSGKDPFDSPPKLLDLLRKGDFGAYVEPSIGTMPVNYLSTVDITNGNSGSATLNARGELVGLAFDGTMEGIISDWWFDEAVNRTIHVDSRYMLFVMDKVDGAQNLLTEMGVR